MKRGRVQVESLATTLQHLGTTLTVYPPGTSMKRGRMEPPVEPFEATFPQKIDNSEELGVKVNTMYNNEYLSDVCLIVGPNRYHAHRLILASWSSVFSTMFSPRWLMTFNKNLKLTESPACQETFQAFLKYFYTCKIKISVTNVLPVLQLADKYAVEHLSKSCKAYMMEHIALSSAYNTFFLWLQYVEPAGHAELTARCKNFTLLNLNLLSRCEDLHHLEPDVMIELLERNDLVIESELFLFKLVANWLNHRLTNVWYYGVDREKADEQLVMSVMEHIRFPMMSRSDIAAIQRMPLVKRFKDFFMWRLGASMAYQSGDQDQAERLVRMLDAPSVQLIFTPRLYTTNLFSFTFEVKNVKLTSRFTYGTYCFSSRTMLSAHACHKDEAMTDWSVDFYPRGVYFEKFFVINWQGLKQCPEHDNQTVRLRLRCQGPRFPQSVKVAICIYQVCHDVEHIFHVIERRCTFEQNGDVVNIDDVIGAEKLLMAMLRCQIIDLKVCLIILPLDKYCCPAQLSELQLHQAGQNLCRSTTPKLIVPFEIGVVTLTKISNEDVDR